MELTEYIQKVRQVHEYAKELGIEYITNAFVAVDKSVGLIYVVLDSTKNYVVEYIEGERGDTGIFRDKETGKVIGGCFEFTKNNIQFEYIEHENYKI